MKKEYKTVVNNVISTFEPMFEGRTKREIISMVYDHINDNKLIADFSKTSLYNTIYYFLRKRNIFKVEEIKYRFDSIDSKLRFLSTVRSDLDERWWFYHDLFFEVERPVLAAGTKVLLGQLNYIIDSKLDPRFDCLYTMLYFRDLRKLVTSDAGSICVKRQLNDKLYGIFDTLYEFDDEIKKMVNSLPETAKKLFLENATQFFMYLSDFNVNDYNKFHNDMVRNVHRLRLYLKGSPFAGILDYNKNRFFDAITFSTMIYWSALRHLDKTNKYADFRSIHFMINSATFFVFFKFAKRLRKNHFGKLVDFFNSDMYFSYSRYVIEYYQVFEKEVAALLESAELESEEAMFKFDIVLRYMLYNKFRNLINSNMKRFITVAYEIGDNSFVDVDDVNDAILYECNLYNESEPTDELTLRNCTEAYEKFFDENNAWGCQDDVTCAAVDICNGEIEDGKYSSETLKLGSQLVSVLMENVA